MLSMALSMTSVEGLEGMGLVVIIIINLDGHTMLTGYILRGLYLFY